MVKPNCSNKLFPVVGIGASAGGLEAFRQLLSHLPTDTGMAFVLIQHLDPNQKSLLREILSRATPMPVVEVLHGHARGAELCLRDSSQHQDGDRSGSTQTDTS